MPLIPSIAAIACLINTMLGWYLLSEEWHNPFHRIGSLFGFYVALYTLGALLSLVLGPSSWVLHLSAVVTVFIPATYLLAVQLLLSPAKRIPAGATWVYWPGLICVLLYLLVTIGKERGNAWLFWIYSCQLDIMLIIGYMSLCFGRGFAHLLQAVAQKYKQKQQVEWKLILWAAVPASIWLVFALTRWLTPLHIPVSLTVVIIAEILLYCLFSEHMIQIVFSDKMVYIAYSISIIGITLGWLLLLRIGIGLTIHGETVLVALGVAFLTTLIFSQPKAMFREMLEKLFFADHYQVRKKAEHFQRELELTREKLWRAERLAVVGEIAATVAHEIKNPLGPILGYAQFLLDTIANEPSIPSKERFEKGLGIISEEVKRIDDKVHKLLSFAKSTRSIGSYCLVHPVIETSLWLLQQKIDDGATIEITTALNATEQGILANPDELQSVFFNILLNAVQAVSPKGKIEIESNNRSQDDRTLIEISIRDNGPGLDATELQKLFEPFYTSKASGTGLGLTIVKGIVSSLNGRIEVASQPGAGAIFTVFFQVVAPLGAAGQEACHENFGS
jgi:signal transduction histidine kinase